MLGIDRVLEYWTKQRESMPRVFEIETIPENQGWIKKMDKFYQMPLTIEEFDMIKNSTVAGSDIKDLQFRLKRKLRYSELQILKLTSDHGIMIRDDDFQP